MKALKLPKWTPIYMGEGHPWRCKHCLSVKGSHRRPDLECDWNLWQLRLQSLEVAAL